MPRCTPITHGSAQTVSRTRTYDAIVLGAGAAGLFCAGRAAQAGLSVLVLDHARAPAEKVRISGGGRCNFTNLETVPERFISANPHFAKSALARYTPSDFLALMAAHGLTWHEKTLGQLFCDQRSGAIIAMLLAELEKGGGALRLQTPVRDIAHADARFRVETDAETFETGQLVVATGGLSIPKMGASGFAYELAERFGHALVTPRPALVPFTVEGRLKEEFAALAGVAAPVRAQAQGPAFTEAMLFTHRGLSGPAMLQVSSYWREGERVAIDFFAGEDGAQALKALKEEFPMRSLAGALETRLPRRLVDYLAGRGLLPSGGRLAEISHGELERVAASLSAFAVTPSGTEGWRTAEVTAGGIGTDGLSSKTMESRHVPGLYFIGECVDVTGWLGGYNFQWAWASAAACAAALETSR